MSKHRNQTVIIPPDQVTPDEAMVIEIPRSLRNKPVVIAQAKGGLQLKKCCDNTEYAMYLNHLQSSKSAPGIMAVGQYVNSSAQHDGHLSYQPQPAAHSYPSHSVPTHSQTVVGGPEKQCGNLTANIFIQTPKSATASINTSTDCLNKTMIESDSDEEDESVKKKGKKKLPEVQNTCQSASDKLFENLVKAIWTSPAPDDCKSHCLKCCENKQQPHVSCYSVKSQANISCATPKTYCERSQMVVMWDDDSASRPSFDDCKTYCLKCCGVTPPTSSSKTRPIAPTLNKSHLSQPHDCKSHCEKCCTNPRHNRLPTARESPSQIEDCQTHCEECCNKRRNQPSRTLMDDCQNYCSSEKLEPPPCPPQPSAISCKPSVAKTLPPGHCKVHCSKCCELASGNNTISAGHFKCVPSSAHCAPKDNSGATLEEDQLCCLNHKDQREKDIVQLYGCDSCWSKYSTKTDPCGCSDWEEDQRPQGDFEFGEPLSKTCDSQIAEINERLDKICAKIEFYEKYFNQADSQEEDAQLECRENCENQPIPAKVTPKCEPKCKNQTKSSKPSGKNELEDDKQAQPKEKPPESNGDEDKSKSMCPMESIDKGKAASDLCQYCCSRSSMKSIPSTCVQRCKGISKTSQEQLKKDTVQAGDRQKPSQEVLKTQTRPPSPPPKPQNRQLENEQNGNDPLSITDSKCKKSCTFVDDNGKSGDLRSNRASEASVCCKCKSKSKTSVLRPIIKNESGKCEGSCSFQITDMESKGNSSQSSPKCINPPSQSSKMCIKCCAEPSLEKVKSQSKVPDGTCPKCPFEQMKESPSAPTNNGNICAKCCKSPSQEVHKENCKCSCEKTKKDVRKVEPQEECKTCCAESVSRKQLAAESNCSCKDVSKDFEDEPKESPAAQKSKCTKCNKEYITATGRKIQSEFKKGLCDTCCLETILSRLKLHAEPDDGVVPDDGSVPDNAEEDSSSRLGKETPETDIDDKKANDKEQQSDLEKQEPKKRRSCFLRKKKSDKAVKNQDNSSKKEK